MRRLAVVINPAVFFNFPKSIKHLINFQDNVSFPGRVINDQRGNPRVLV